MTDIDKFIEWLYEGGIVLASWDPRLNELMPITFGEQHDRR